MNEEDAKPGEARRGLPPQDEPPQLGPRAQPPSAPPPFAAGPQQNPGYPYSNQPPTQLPNNQLPNNQLPSNQVPSRRGAQPNAGPQFHDPGMRPPTPQQPTPPNKQFVTTEKPPAKETKKPSKIVLIVLAILVALALIVAIVIGLVIASRPTEVDAAEKYFAALEATDAETAKSFLGEISGDQSLLTQEVLTASSAKISDVLVEDADKEDGLVEVQYQLGDEQIAETISVKPNAEGEFKISEMASLNAATVSPEVELTLSGSALPKAEVLLFPGVYEIAASHEYLQIAAPTVTVSASRAQTEAELMLSDSANEPFREAAKAKVAECETRTEVQAPDCGWKFGGVKDDPDNKPETVKCEAKSTESIDSAEFLLADGTSAMASINLEWECEVELSKGGTGTPEQPLITSRVKVDFSDPSSLVASFG